MQTHKVFSRTLLAGSMLSGMGIGVGANAADLAVYEPVPVVPVAPAPVNHHNVSGVIDVYAAYTFADPGFYDYGFIGGGGKANIWLSPAASLQLDAWGETGDSFGGTSYSSFGAAGHLAWRNPNSYAVAAMVSYGSPDNTQTQWATFALEGQAYFNNFTLYGQAGYVTGVSGAASSYDGFYVFGEGRYFFTPNIMASGHLAYDSVSAGGCSGCDAWRWGLSLEGKHDNSGLVGFASYQGSSFFQSDEHTFLGGMKVLFGHDTLLAADRYGATFTDHNPMYGRSRIRTLYLEN